MADDAGWLSSQPVSTQRPTQRALKPDGESTISHTHLCQHPTPDPKGIETVMIATS